MTKKIGLFTIASLMLGCGELVSTDRAVQAVRDDGFTNINVVEQHGVAPTLYGCDKHDAVAFEVTATNSQQRRVNLTVCCGLVFKGCTIRH
ncbi:hypothetical protein KBD61_04455 [Patescibacteria group bacterium]|nr:hypothetical protein [Patescibacteria group bacterium]MBP9710246.1 hypothetical protein [Patescibacteria group bacterium]